MPLECFLVRGVFLVQFFSAAEKPVDRAVGKPAVISRIKIRGYVFRVPAQVILEQEVGRRGVAPHVVATVDAQRLEQAEVARAIVLPHHDDVIAPLPAGWARDEVAAASSSRLSGSPFLLRPSN